MSANTPSRLVVGADQVLALDSEIFTKPESRAAAKAQLAKLSGRTHALQSAVCVARDGAILFEAISTAHMTCRTLSPGFIDRYIGVAGDVVLTSVGAINWKVGRASLR